MKATGIICEYNPLHNGHIYHMEETRRQSGADALVLAMSGDFVQRGEMALLNKWERARLAVDAGADLVVEIPTLYCLSDAGKYAKGGVSVLKALGLCDSLSFGSESGELATLSLIAKRLEDNKEEIERAISQNLNSGLSYPSARKAAYENLFGDAKMLGEEKLLADAETLNNEKLLADAETLDNANDILAIEYLKQLANSDIEPISIKRIGATYNEAINTAKEFQSASAIRKAFEKGEDISSYVPANVLSQLNQARLHGAGCADVDNMIGRADRLFDLVRYAIISATAEQIDKCPSGGEGLGNRIKEAAITAENMNELILATKSKRYTYTRISRLSLQILLGIDRDIYEYNEAPYIRLLAANERGRELISIAKKKELNSVPILTNINKNANELSDYGRKLLDLDVKASNIYNMINGLDLYKESDYCIKPYIKD